MIRRRSRPSCVVMLADREERGCSTVADAVAEAKDVNGGPKELNEFELNAIRDNAEKLAEIRSRLSDISWEMRQLPGTSGDSRPKQAETRPHPGDSCSDRDIRQPPAVSTAGKGTGIRKPNHQIAVGFRTVRLDAGVCYHGQA
ncbi:MAG: hypothetical protein KDA96_05080 [Planctomycetaceae bacterium]|nr:hypothetical protein [Planctomycetaceae bacterium]